MKYLFLIFTLVLLGCASNKSQQLPDNDSIPIINLSDDVLKVESLPLSEAASKVEVIPLEMTDKSLIGEIAKLQVTDDNIWIESYGDERRLFRFSRSGKYLNKVGMIGQGPQEYIRMDDFCIDNIRKEVYIVTTTCGIKVYDFEGKFKRIATNILVDDMFMTAYTQYLFYDNRFFIAQNLALYNIPTPKDSVWSFALLDSTFHKKKIFKNPAHIGREKQIIENGVRFDVFVNYWTETPTDIDTYSNQLTLKYPDTDTIYQFDSAKEELLPQYVIFTNEEKGDYATTHLLYRERKAFDYFYIRSYYPSEDFIYLLGRKEDKILTYCYNKQDGSVRMQERQGEIIEKYSTYLKLYSHSMRYKFLLTNDLCGGDFTIDYRSSGKYWVDVLEPGSEDNWIDVEQIKASTVKNEAEKQKFVKTLEGVDEESNPILVIATLK